MHSKLSKFGLVTFLAYRTFFLMAFVEMTMLGPQLETPTFSWVINTPRMDGGKHYVTIFMLAVVLDADQEPKLMEPDKCEGRCFFHVAV